MDIIILARGNIIQTCTKCGGHLALNKAKDKGKCIECNIVFNNPKLSTIQEYTEETITVIKGGVKKIYSSIQQLPDDLRNYYETLDKIHVILDDREIAAMDLKSRTNEDGKREYMVNGTYYGTYDDLPEELKPLFYYRNKEKTMVVELFKIYDKFFRDIKEHRMTQGPSNINLFKDGLKPNDVSASLMKTYRDEYDMSPKEKMEFCHCPNCNKEIVSKSTFLGGRKCEICTSKIIVFRLEGNKMIISRS